MKTQILTVATAAVALLGLAGAAQADATAQCPARCATETSSYQSNGGKSFTGNVVAVDTHNNMVAVKNFFGTRHFNLANDCSVSLQDKTVAGLGDLRPGERVAVRYDSDNGVRIAKYITQHDLMYSGHITAIDAQARTLSIRDGLWNHNLLIGQNCAVLMKDNKPGGLNNVHIGDTVRIAYEPMSGARIADRIQENSAMFAGTIEAMDANGRFITVNNSQGERRFNLGDNCPIVINGNMAGALSDLRIGEKVSVNYDAKDGVLVANRLSPSTVAPEPAPSAQTANLNGLPYSGGY